MKKIQSQAELKPVKVGEPLASNVDGNPEPSSSKRLEQACVETRRRVCIKCQKPIPLHKYKNAKYCSDRCRNAYISHQHAIKTGKIRTPYVGSGGNQEGELNPNYKTGIGTYSSKGFKAHGKKCNRCTSTRNLLVHHRDHDRRNNKLSNLEVLCKKCHQKHHCKRDATGKYTKG